MSTSKNTNANETIDVSRLMQLISDLVAYPDDVSVIRTIDEKGVLLQIRVNASDMPIIIGRGGIMSNSIKTYMRALGKAHGMNIRLEFLEPEGSGRQNGSVRHTDIDNDIALGGEISNLHLD